MFLCPVLCAARTTWGADTDIHIEHTTDIGVVTTAQLEATTSQESVNEDIVVARFISSVTSCLDHDATRKLTTLQRLVNLSTEETLEVYVSRTQLQSSHPVRGAIIHWI